MRFGLFLMGSRGATYAQAIDQAVAAELAGFHSVVVAERHFRHADLLFSSALAAGAAIAARTSRIRIGVAGRILSLDHPVHVAEDAATLDVISSGRLDFGVTRASLDPACHAAFGAPSLDGSRERYEEALDVIVGAWTQDVLRHDGPHYEIPEVSVFPRPVQNPHPPIFVVAVSPESLALAARRGYSAYLGATRPHAQLRENALEYRAILDEAGHDPASVSLPVNRFVYVAETDDRARREFEAPLLELIRERAPDLRPVLEQRYGGELPYARFVEDFLVVGSPETVTARLHDLAAEAGCTDVLATLNFVTLDHELAMRSMALFAEEVMPACREAVAAALP